MNNSELIQPGGSCGEDSWDGEAGVLNSPLGNGPSYSSCDFDASKKQISRTSKLTKGCRAITNELFGGTVGGAVVEDFDSPLSARQSYVSCDFGVPVKQTAHTSKLTRGCRTIVSELFADLGYDGDLPDLVDDDASSGEEEDSCMSNASENDEAVWIAYGGKLSSDCSNIAVESNPLFEEQAEDAGGAESAEGIEVPVTTDEFMVMYANV